MKEDDISRRVERLDTGLFDGVASQTSERDRRSLLAVQRAIARRFSRYVYLEIGSHLGGSIQPHLLDRRCVRIYSIDPRPSSQPDDRSPGCRVDYPNNSTAAMLEALARISPKGVEKITCFESDAAAVDRLAIEPRPHLAFIDGEHTQRAVLSDFAFCRAVLAAAGAVVFDDFPIVYPALLEIRRVLRRDGEDVVALRLEGKAFAMFRDAALVRTDPFLERCRARSRLTLARYGWKLRAKSLLPGSAGSAARAALRG